MHRQMLIRKSAVQNPRRMPTAIKGRKMATIIRRISEQLIFFSLEMSKMRAEKCCL